MRVVQSGKYFRVLPSSDAEHKQLCHRLMGWRQRKGDLWMVAEDNLVNRIVLGQSTDLIYSGVVACDVTDERLKEYRRAMYASCAG